LSRLQIKDLWREHFWQRAVQMEIDDIISFCDVVTGENRIA